MKKVISFEWTVPEVVFGDDFKEEDLRKRVQEGVVLSLFKEGKISSGLAAEMLRISRREFLDILYRKGLPYFDFDEEELEKEFTAFEELKQILKEKKGRH